MPMMAMASDKMVEVYPQRPITLVLGYPPGGGADVLARHIAKHMSDELRQKVIVDYRPGAAGSVAAVSVARAEPDGYTIYLASTSLMLHQIMHRNQGLDLSTDLTPVAMVAEVPLVLVMGKHVPATTLPEAIRVAGKTPGKLSCASIGIGSVGDLLCDELQRATGVRLLHVPYKGDAQALVDVIAGRADFYISGLIPILPHMKAGRVRGMAILSGGRLARLPGVPGIAELGFMKTTPAGWYAVMAPRETPDYAIDRLNRSMKTVLAMPELRRQLTALGYVVPSSPKLPEAVGKYIAKDAEVWSETMKANGLDGMH